MRLKAIVHKEAGGGYWAKVPALPGCATQGDTHEELLRNLQEAVEGWLLAAEDMDSQEGDVEIIDIAV